MTNKRLKPRLGGAERSQGLNNPAAVGISARKFGGGLAAGGSKVYQFGQKKNNLLNDDESTDMISVGGGSGYDDAMSDIGGIRRVDGGSEYDDNQSMLSINRYEDSDAGTIVNGGDSDTSMAMTEVRGGAGSSYDGN